MRYVAKVHVLDVLDQIVISGYVLDADDWTNPDHETTEFVYQRPGTGLSDPHEWLTQALTALLEQSNGPSGLRA